MGVRSYQRQATKLWDHIWGSVEALIEDLAALDVLSVKPLTTLRIEAGGITILQKGSERQAIAFSAIGPPREAVKCAVRELDAGLGKDCTVEIAHDLAVTNRIILPAENDEILRAIVRNKVESIAPWPIAQSLHVHRITPVPGDDSHVAVDVWVVGRALLEGVVSELAAAGTAVRLALLKLPSGESLHIDFGSREESREMKRLASRVAAGFAVTAALVAGLGLILAWNSASRLAADRNETARLTATLRPVASGDAASLIEAAVILHERRRQRLPAVAVINELSEILPQNVWLDSLSLDDARLDLRGQGSGIPSLIGILEGSPSLRDVNFTSATQRNADSNAEAFSIGASVEPAPEEEMVP